MNYLNLIQINVNLPRVGNELVWTEIQVNCNQLMTELIAKLFLEGVKAQVFYLESHQLNINLAGSLMPEAETELILKYDNEHEFLTQEVSRLVAEVLAKYQYSLELGRMNFVPLTTAK